MAEKNWFGQVSYILQLAVKMQSKSNIKLFRTKTQSPEPRSSGLTLLYRSPCLSLLL